jgi:hypothetical protein
VLRLARELLVGTALEVLHRRQAPDPLLHLDLALLGHAESVAEHAARSDVAASMGSMALPSRRFHVPSALRPSSLRVEPEDAHELVAAGALLVDVRRQDDPSPSLAGAVRISPDMVPGRVPELRREVAIVLACT